MIIEQREDSVESDAADEAATLEIIINPAAGGGSAGRRWPDFARALSNHGYAVRVHETTGPGDATTIARTLAEAGTRTIVCVGGDGTINEVVNGLILDDRAIDPELRLAIISCGTGKDLARSLGTRDIDESLQALSNGVTTRIDVGRVVYLDGHTGQLNTRYLVNVADAGIGAAVADRISSTSRRLGGLVTYLRAAVRTIIGYKPWMVAVDADDEQVYEGMAGMVVFANGRYFAGGMLVAPDASLCDGLIDVFVLEGVGKRALLTSLLPRVYRGKHVGQPGVKHFPARSAAVRTAPGMLVELDGEQLGQAPLSVTVVPGVLRVVSPASSLDDMSGCADVRS